MRSNKIDPHSGSVIRNQERLLIDQDDKDREHWLIQSGMSSGGPDDLNLNSSIFLETDDDLTGGFKARVNPMKTP